MISERRSRKNGFKFPKDDETFVKEPPVLLGAKAQKEAFPSAVYPGEIPGSVPVAFRYSGNFNYNAKQPIQAGFLPRTDLFVPNTFTIIGAGSFGPTISFWVDNEISVGNAVCAIIGSPAGTPCTTNNPLQFGIPQRGIEIGGYPNGGYFTWSAAVVDGLCEIPSSSAL